MKIILKEIDANGKEVEVGTEVPNTNNIEKVIDLLIHKLKLLLAESLIK